MAFFDALQQVFAAQSPLAQGISIVDIPHLPEPLRGVVNQLNRGGPLTLAQFAAQWSLDDTGARDVLSALTERGLLKARDKDGQNVYEVRLGWRGGRVLSIVLPVHAC